LRGFLAQDKEAPTTHTLSGMLGGADAGLRQKDRKFVPVLSFTDH